MPKMKTKSSAKKRFKITASGKVKVAAAGKQHGQNRQGEHGYGERPAGDVGPDIGRYAGTERNADDAEADVAQEVGDGRRKAHQRDHRHGKGAAQQGGGGQTETKRHQRAAETGGKRNRHASPIDVFHLSPPL